MHSIDSIADHQSPRSKLRATLHRLHRHLEGNRHREQAALELFGTWQAQWSDHREVIAQQLEWLDRELSQLTTSGIPVPHLSLLALSTAADDHGEAESLGAGDEHPSFTDEREGIISPAENPWKSA